MEMKNVMFLAIFGALLVGCSEEEIANVETSSQNAISFNVVSNAAETKATPITPSNLTTTDFDVFAYTADGTAFMGVADKAFLHDGVKIVYKGGKWDYDDPSELRYWPTKALDFYAVSPASLVNNDRANHYTWNFNHDSQQIFYTCLDEYNTTILDSDKHANHDVMYGIAKEQTRNSNNGKVHFTFKHILSQVVFKAKKELLANMNVTISSIKIMNLYKSGTFTLPTSATDAPSSSNWAPGLKAKSSGTVVRMGEDITVSNDGISISMDQPLLTIPQTLTAWNVKNTETKTKAKADDAGQSYLEISCKIQQAGVYLCGSADGDGTIYVPFGASWEPGKRYIYTMIFGGGYDENGDKILKPIEFEAETEDWVDDAGNDHEVNM